MLLARGFPRIESSRDRAQLVEQRAWRKRVRSGFPGIYVEAGANFLASGNTVARNGVSFSNAIGTPGTLKTLGNNAVRENSPDTAETITPVGSR